MNPYPEYITDEASGIQVKNYDWEVWNEGRRSVKVSMERYQEEIARKLWRMERNLGTWKSVDKRIRQSYMSKAGVILSLLEPLIEEPKEERIVNWILENVIKQSSNPTIFPLEKWYLFKKSLQGGSKLRDGE